MKIFILEGKNGEVLGMLTGKDENMTFGEFRELVNSIGSDNDNDFYIIKDELINNYDMQVVEVVGGVVCSKRKGAF